MRPATPASPRDSAAVAMPLRDAVRADRLGDAGHLAVEHRPGHLRSPVGRRQAGAAGRHDQVDARRRRRPAARRRTGSPSGTTSTRRPSPKPQLVRAATIRGPGRVLVDPGRRAVRDREHVAPSPSRPASLTRSARPGVQSPLRPPDLRSTRTSLDHRGLVDGLDHVDRRARPRRTPRSAPPSRRRCGRSCGPWR